MTRYTLLHVRIKMGAETFSCADSNPIDAVGRV
jgi:hypothetical protein